MNNHSAKRCGTVAILGETNVGKSTLLNHLVGAKVSIVTHKINTTRRRVRGIITDEANQLILIDTPGIFQTNKVLDKGVLNSVWGAVSNVDSLILMTDPTKKLSKNFKKVWHDFSMLSDKVLNKILVINKIDQVEKTQLLILSEELNSAIKFSETFMISAKKGHGVKNLRDWLLGNLPHRDWMFPSSQLHSLSPEILAAERTLESLLLRIHQEIPYTLKIKTDTWEEFRDGSVRIGQTIYVRRDGHRGIILGPKGLTIKEISRAARMELSSFLNRKVHLFIGVKVLKKSDDPSIIEQNSN